MQLFAAIVLIFLGGVGRSFAAEVKILFVPPPMEGTISFGIYDSTGKLVRVLHKEAEVTEFASALNGLVATWDGNNDKGGTCPPGQYHARGNMVGDLDIDGVDFHGNDWVTEDDSPRICRITDIGMSSGGIPVLRSRIPGQNQAWVFCIALKPPESEDESQPYLIREPEPDAKLPEPSIAISDGQIHGVKTPGVTHVIDAALGANSAVWVIDGAMVKEFSSTGQLQHTTPTKPGDPVPVKIAASRSSDRIYVLEENSRVQRLRGLKFTGTASEPTVLFEKSIRLCDRFDQVASTLTFPDGKPFVSSSTLSLTLAPNPLFQNKPGKIDVMIAMDEKGSFLATADGLPLYRISETPHLRWAVMGRPEDAQAVTIFESDGAVISEFKAEHLDRMMAFDAGEVQLPAANASPTPPGRQDGEAVPSPTATPQPPPTQASPTP